MSVNGAVCAIRHARTGFSRASFHSAYRTGVVEKLVSWLELPDAVMPSMLAFAGGLGGEGTETFTRILLSETLLKDRPGAMMLVSR